MTNEQKKQVVEALMARFSNATDNAARARAQKQRGVYSFAESILFDHYEREEKEALELLRSFEREM